MKKTKLTIYIISKEKKHADRQIKPLKNGSNTAVICLSITSFKYLYTTIKPQCINDSHSNSNINKKNNFSLREQKAQIETNKIHKTHYESTNYITKHRSNQNYSTIQATINKEYKITKEIKKTKQPKKWDIEKKKNKIESQPTPASNWLSQAQQWKKKESYWCYM